MSELSKRSTVYFEADIHQALRIKAATTHQSVSEDQEDLSAFSERKKEATLSYEKLLEDLKEHGKI